MKMKCMSTFKWTPIVRVLCRRGGARCNAAYVNVITVHYSSTFSDALNKLKSLRTLRVPTSMTNMKSKLQGLKKPLLSPLQALTVPPTEELENVRDRYIPFSRYTIIREIIQDSHIFAPEEKEKFEDLCQGLDNAILTRYYGVLQELKTLFDPVNPHEDTIDVITPLSQSLGRREKLDKEFWLLQRLQPVMERAGFRELTRSELEHVLRDRAVPEGVTVSLDVNSYATLKMWVLGRETPRFYRDASLWKALKESFWAKFGFERVAQHAYKRVVVSVRGKTEDQVQLKMFSDVPSSQLHQVLPVHRLRMTQWDKAVLTSLLSLGGGALGLKLVAYYLATPLNWSLALALGAGLVATRHYTLHFERRTRFYRSLNQSLYSRGVATNRGLLTLLVDRAQDEDFKSAILCYAHLLRLPQQRVSSAAQLETVIEDWLRGKAGPRRSELEHFEFQSEFALDLLQAFGLVEQNAGDGSYHAMPLESALSCLPVQGKTSWITGTLPLRESLGSLRVAGDS